MPTMLLRGEMFLKYRHDTSIRYIKHAKIFKNYCNNHYSYLLMLSCPLIDPAEENSRADFEGHVSRKTSSLQVDDDAAESVLLSQN